MTLLTLAWTWTAGWIAWAGIGPCVASLHTPIPHTLTAWFDDKTQVVDAGGLTFEVPATWKASPGTNAMRRAQVVKPAVEDDPEPAELIVFVFPGGAGGIEANIERWRSQFQDDKGQPPPAKTETLKVGDLEVTTVEINGRYVASVRPGSPQTFNKPGFALLGAIILTDDAGYFLKMVGPRKTMDAAKPEFQALVKSIKAK